MSGKANTQQKNGVVFFLMTREVQYKKTNIEARTRNGNKNICNLKTTTTMNMSRLSFDSKENVSKAWRHKTGNS